MRYIVKNTRAGYDVIDTTTGAVVAKYRNQRVADFAAFYAEEKNRMGEPAERHFYRFAAAQK